MSKLFCEGDPHALGIEKNGEWDMGVFATHIQKCEICRCALQKLTGIPQARCAKCGHTFTPRKWPPMICPSCHKVMRDKPKKESEGVK